MLRYRSAIARAHEETEIVKHIIKTECIGLWIEIIEMIIVTTSKISTIEKKWHMFQSKSGRFLIYLKENRNLILL